MIDRQEYITLRSANKILGIALEELDIMCREKHSHANKISEDGMIARSRPAKKMPPEVYKIINKMHKTESLSAIARHLNELGYRSITGCLFNGQSVRRAFQKA